MADTPDESKKSMDIHAPSDVKPSSSSRPIIVSNRSVMQDPMVKNGSDESKESAKPESEAPKEELRSPSASKKVIQPASSSDTSDDSEKDTESNDATKEEAESSPASETDSDVKDKPEDSVDESKAKDDDSNNAAVVDAVIGSAKKEEPRDEATADAKRKQNAEVLIDSKKFNVPIGQVTKAKKNRRLVLLSILVLVLVLAYVMIDAGLAKVPFELPYRFFGENSSVVEESVTQTQPQQAQEEATTEEQASDEPIVYTEENGLFSLTYPGNWSTTESVEEDSLAFYPGSEEADATPDRLILIRGGSEYQDKQVGELSYVKSVPLQENSYLYLVERIYKVVTQIDGEGFYVSASVESEEATEDLGNETTRSGPDIEIGGEPKTYLAFFYTNTNATDANSGLGYETLEEAKAVFQSEEYQVIKQILLSLKI